MGSMNVGKVSFGNTPVAGTTPGAAQQAPVKKADKGDVVVIGGKEIKKSTLAKGGIIATAAAALGTIAMAAKRGKVVNGSESKFIANVKEGFKTFVGKGKETYKAAVEKAKTAVDGTKDKAPEAAANKTEEVVQNTAGTTTNKGVEAPAVQKVENQAPAAPSPEAPKADAGEKVTSEAGQAVKKAKSQELEQKAQNLQAKLDEQTKKLADLKAEQVTLEKRTTDLPGVIQKQKDEAELAQMVFDEAKTKGASKKELGKLKQTLDTEKQKLADLEKAQKEVAARKKVVDGQIKGLEGKKAADGRKKMEDSIKQINKQAVEAKKTEFKEGSEELKKLNSELDSLKATRAELTGTDEATVRKQDQYDRVIASKEGKIKTYEQEADKLVEAKIALDAKDAEIVALNAKIAQASKADKATLEAQLKTLKAEKAALSSAYNDADIALFHLAGGIKKA